MSFLRALCCLSSVKKQKHDLNLSVLCIIKQNPPIDVYSCFDTGCPAKAYVTMPIGTMGRKSLALIDQRSRCLPARKEEA